MLSEAFLPFAHQHFVLDFWYQQDNAAIHTSYETRTFFLDQGVNVLDWPARLPDLNPMKNLWAILSRRVSDEGKKQYDSDAESREAIKRAWANIESDTLRRLVSSMPSRCIDTVERHGDKIEY